MYQIRPSPYGRLRPSPGRLSPADGLTAGMPALRDTAARPWLPSA